MILNFSSNSSINIEDYQKEGIRIFITGQSGSGKSYLSKVLLEEFADLKYPIIIIDPEGEYASFKEMYSTIIIGGRNGDTSFEAINVDLEEIIEVLYKGDFRILIFDTSQKMTSDQANLHADILESIFKLAGSRRYPLVLLIEEAHIVAPERKRTTRSLELAIEVAKRGRKRGIQSIWVTQRPADISKQVISQCNIRFFGRLQDPADIAALRPYIRSAGVLENQLMGLDKEFFMYASGETKLVKSRPLKIKDLGLTPSFKKTEIKDIAALTKKDIIDKFTNPNEKFYNIGKSQNYLNIEREEDNTMGYRDYPSEIDTELLNITVDDTDTMKLIFSESLKNQLILRGKLDQIRTEKQNYLNGLKALEEDLNSGSKSLIEIENKVKQFKDKILELKDKEKVMKLNLRKLPHEKMISDKKNFETQIKKLDRLLESGKIKETTYHELRNEFLTKIDDIKNRVKIVRSEMQKLMVSLTKEISTMEKELELLYARYEIGQIDKDSYYNMEEDLRRKLNDYRSCLKVLKKEQTQI